MIDFFETQRMQAKRINIADLNDLIYMHQNERMMATLGGVRSIQKTRENLSWNIKQWDDNGFGLWMFHTKVYNQLIGRAGMRRVVINDIEEVELGFALMPEYWGRGLATEMATACREIAFKKLGLTNIVSFTSISNLASQRVMQKLGFVYEKDIELAGKTHVLYRLFNCTNSNLI